MKEPLKCVLIALCCVLVAVSIGVAWRAYLFMGIVNGQSPSVLSGAYHVLMTGNVTMATQNVYWKKASDQTNIILGTIRNQLNPKYEGGLAMAVKNFNQDVIDFGALIRNTDTSLNDKDKGLLAQLGFTLVSVREQVVKIGAENGPIDSSSKAMQNLATLLANPDLPKMLHNVETGTGAFSRAGTSVENILFDLQHPERPGKFIRAVQIMFQILGVTSKMGQTGIPPFNGR